jgi:hypothetical protein
VDSQQISKQQYHALKTNTRITTDPTSDKSLQRGTQTVQTVVNLECCPHTLKRMGYLLELLQVPQGKEAVLVSLVQIETLMKMKPSILMIITMRLG